MKVLIVDDEEMIRNVLREGISPVGLPQRVWSLRGLGMRGETMPRTRIQHIAFSILMAFAMVYGMELYNQALMAGGLSTSLFAAPFADIVPLMIAVIVLETLVGGRVAGALMGRLVELDRCPEVLATILRGAFTCWAMCPMMSMVATIAFKQPEAGEFMATWL